MPERTRAWLTPRQWAVLERLAAGESNAAIAAALGVSVATVSGYLAAIYRRLPPADGRTKRAAAAAWYRAAICLQRAPLRGTAGVAASAVSVAPPPPAVRPPPLTPPQWQLLAQLARGANDSEIAAALGLTRAAVGNRLRALYRLLPLGDAANRRAAAAVWYLRAGHQYHEEAGGDG